MSGPPEGGAGGVAAPKRVTVLVRRPPLNDSRAGSAVRMALGLEIKDHEVTVAFLDEGVFAALAGLDPVRAGGDPWADYLEMLHACGHRLWAEAESLGRFGLDPARLFPGVEAVPGERIAAALPESEAVLSL